jgi:hypothetical protein
MHVHVSHPLGRLRGRRARLAAVTLAVAVGAGTTVGVVSSATASATVTTTSPAKAAAGWLARQLTGPHHDHYSVSYGGTEYPDAGETVDALLAMDAAKVSQRAAARITTWLQANAKDYATGSGYTPGTYYPGSLAKLLLAAEAQHVDVHHFGGLDLVKELRREEQPNGAYLNTGDTTYGSTPVAQALAFIALSHAGSLYDWPDARAIGWLVGQQCGDGGFSSSTQSTPAKTCTDVDATAYAAQALLTVHSSAAARAMHWLATHQNRDGGYGLDTKGRAASNANSTAVAAQAQLQAGHTARANRALAWLRDHQVGCSGAVSRRGAVRLSGTTFSQATALRATTQAAQALAGRWLGRISAAGAIDAAPVLRC